jgi:hypothetical protein
MKLQKNKLETLRGISRRLGVEKQAARAYLSFTSAMRSSLKQDLEEIEFDTIDLESHEEIAFFPEFYSRDYRTTLHGVIAHGLNYRGVGSLFLFGDGSLDACKGKSSQHDDRCVRCVKQSNEFADIMNLPNVFLDEINYDDSVKSDEIESVIEKYAASSTLRLTHTAEVNYDNPEHVQILNDYKRTGRIAWDIAEKLDRKYNFDYYVSTGSAYLPRRMCQEYAKRNDIPILASSDPIYGENDNEIMFSRMDGPLTHYISDSSWETIKQDLLDSKRESELDEFMSKRTENIMQVRYANTGRTIETDEESDLYSMYTHLPWDAAIQDVSRIFEDQYEWVAETIEQFESMEDKQLIIKVHPAEKLRGTKQGVTDVLETYFQDLPQNVRVLEPDTEVDPYGLMQTSDVVLVYTSTVGMEATYFGTPAVTAADSHYAKKGFTYDPETNEEYAKILRKPASELELTEEEISLGKRYLYNYFIERPTKFELVKEKPYSSDESMVEELDSISDLKPGKNNTLEDICRTITENTLYPYTKKHN